MAAAALRNLTEHLETRQIRYHCHFLAGSHTASQIGGDIREHTVYRCRNAAAMQSLLHQGYIAVGRVDAQALSALGGCGALSLVAEAGAQLFKFKDSGLVRRLGLTPPVAGAAADAVEASLVGDFDTQTVDIHLAHLYLHLEVAYSRPVGQFELSQFLLLHCARVLKLA